jgi:hypothetical protein
MMQYLCDRPGTIWQVLARQCLVPSLHGISHTMPLAYCCVVHGMCQHRWRRSVGMQGEAVTTSAPFAMQESCDARLATWFEACVCSLRNKKGFASTCKCGHMVAFAG